MTTILTPSDITQLIRHVSWRSLIRRLLPVFSHEKNAWPIMQSVCDEQGEWQTVVSEKYCLTRYPLTQDSLLLSDVRTESPLLLTGWPGWFSLTEALMTAMHHESLMDSQAPLCISQCDDFSYWLLLVLVHGFGMDECHLAVDQELLPSGWCMLLERLPITVSFFSDLEKAQANACFLIDSSLEKKPICPGSMLTMLSQVYQLTKEYHVGHRVSWMTPQPDDTFLASLFDVTL